MRLYARDKRLSLEEDTDEARNGRHVVGAAGAARRGDEAPLCRRRLSARHADLRLPQGPSRPHRPVRSDGHRARQADARGRDLPYLLDEQADHRGCADDAGRGGADRPRRHSAQPHPRVAKPRRLRERHAVAVSRCAAQLYHDPHLAADESRRPRDPHLRADLRLYDAQRGRRRLSQGQGDRPSDRWRIAGDDRPIGENTARFLAGNGLELFCVDRRAGLPRREIVRHELRRVPAHAAVRAARHE